MTQEQFKILSEHSAEVNMAGMELRYLDMSGLDLRKANFKYCDLEGANFSNSDLSGAKLKYTNLKNANFSNANLEEADLSYAHLGGAILAGAKTTKTNFKYSYVSSGKDKTQFTDFSNILYNTGIWGQIGSFIAGALLVYGMSGIVFFTNQILNAQNPAIVHLNQYLIVNNVLTGLGMVGITFLMADWLKQHFKDVWIQHLILSTVAIIYCFVLGGVMYEVAGSKVFSEAAQIPSSDARDASPLFYLIGPILVCNLFLYFYRQSQHISQKISEQELEISKMSELRTKAEFEALQAKINPHFLYNSLNSIASLVHQNPDKAENMVLHLSKFYRYSTTQKNEYFDTIEQELTIVQTYLEVEKVRFDERLHYEVQYADESLKNCLIPRFILQPIVENAIKHGISKIAENGFIKIKVHKTGKQLSIEIIDNGPFFPDTISSGYGLKSIQDKLQLLCGETASMELINEPEKMVKVNLEVK